MDLNYINPFIQAAIEIIKEVVGIKVHKDEVYVRKGRKSQHGVGIILDVFQDVDGRIIFDLSNEMTKTFATEMIGLNISNEEELRENKDLLESAIKELGNMISGRAITLLEERNYNCDIKPPNVYMGKNIILADPQHICIVIDFTSEYGNFSLCLTNKSDSYLQTIRLVLSNVNEYIQDALVFSFLPRGFEMYEMNDRVHLMKLLSNEEIDFLVINTDELDNIKKDLKILRDRSKKQNLRVIAYTSNRDIEIFEELFDEYVSFVLPKYFNENEAVQALKKFFEAAGLRHSERRKHVRVDIQKDETVKITFPAPSGSFIEGKIKNLSIGGALFQTNNGNLLKEISVGHRIEGIQLSIEGRIVRTSGAVIYRKDFLTAIRFVDLKENFVKVISKYIFKKISKHAESRMH